MLNKIYLYTTRKSIPIILITTTASFAGGKIDLDFDHSINLSPKMIATTPTSSNLNPIYALHSNEMMDEALPAFGSGLANIGYTAGSVAWNVLTGFKGVADGGYGLYCNLAAIKHSICEDDTKADDYWKSAGASYRVSANSFKDAVYNTPTTLGYLWGAVSGIATGFWKVSKIVVSPIVRYVKSWSLWNFFSTPSRQEIYPSDLRING